MLLGRESIARQYHQLTDYVISSYHHPPHTIHLPIPTIIAVLLLVSLYSGFISRGGKGGLLPPLETWLPPLEICLLVLKILLEREST